MKVFKFKIFIITSIVCLLPVIAGILLWNKLPDTMAIHFDIYNNPDNFCSKSFVVFGMPLLMVLLQGFCCFINDINAHKYGTRVKFERITKWIIPILSVLLQLITFGYSLNINIDIRKAVTVIIGIMFLVIGNYMPKFNRIKNYNTDTEIARKINRFVGIETVIMGVLFLISAFLPVEASIICLILLIPYAATGIIYGIYKGKK